MLTNFYMNHICSYPDEKVLKQKSILPFFRKHGLLLPDCQFCASKVCCFNFYSANLIKSAVLHMVRSSI
jgi:hypothetical protein